MTAWRTASEPFGHSEAWVLAHHDRLPHKEERRGLGTVGNACRARRRHSPSSCCDGASGEHRCTIQRRKPAAARPDISGLQGLRVERALTHGDPL